MNYIKNLNKNSIAVVRKACRYTEYINYNIFWNNLEEGINSIKEIPSDRWGKNKYYSSDIDISDKSICKWGGFIKNIE